MENIKSSLSVGGLSLILTILIAAGFLIPTFASASTTVNAWWPTNGSTMTGVQPFKAMVQGLDVSQYEMFWQVDGGTWNAMANNSASYPHKEASVDVTGWNWHGSGPYTINFIARQNGVVIAQRSETIYISNGQARSAASPSASATVATPASTSAPLVAAVVAKAAPASTVQNSSSSLATKAAISTVQTANGVALYVDPTSDAATQESLWKGNDQTGASAMAILAAQPTAVWFGNWNSNVENDVHSLVTAAASNDTVPVLVTYNIPERDCGGFSAGGSDNPAGYAAWISSFASGLGSSRAIVILEPDALAQIGCLSAADQATRLTMLSNAVSTIKNDPQAKVYIDAGHSNWIDASTMAKDLTAANIARADGFSLNVSNFMPTSDETSYGTSVSALVGNKHFVIDTSRNGNGSNGQWCNPSGMAIGEKPTTSTGNSLIDAYLWVKTPGESDGSCNGGPSAGVWWPSYALSLVQNAHQ